MGYYNNQGVWVEGDPPAPRPVQGGSAWQQGLRPRQMPSADVRARSREPGVRQQARNEQRQGRYDNDGNWVEGAPANFAETVDDFRRSLGTGVERGIAGLAQMPRMVADANETSANFLTNAIASIPGLDATEQQRQAASRLIRSGFDRISPGLPELARVGPTTEQIDQGIDDAIPGERHTPETTAGEYGRTIGEFVPGVIMPGGISRNLATTAARVVVPAVASELGGQITEGTDAEPYARFIGALLGSGLTEGSISILTRQGLTPDDRALRLINRELQDAGYQPEEIVRVMNRLRTQAPTEEIMGELMGPSGQRLMRATAAMGRGAGRSRADAAFNARSEGGVRLPAPTPAQPNRTRAVGSIRDRVMNEAVEMTAPTQTSTPRNYDDALDALRTARSGQGQEAYRALYAQNIDNEPGIRRLLDYLAEAPPEAAASGARQLRSVADGLRARRASAAQRASRAPGVSVAQRRSATQELDQINAELDDVVTSINQLDSIANGQAPNTLRPRTVDYMQRGLNQLERNAGLGSPEARAFGDARRAYNQMADDLVPGFGETRSRYGDSIRIEELMNDGRRVFEMTEGEIDRLMRGSNGSGLGREEFDGFMIGVLDAVERRLGQSDTAFLARLSRNQNWRNQLATAVGGEANAQRFMNRLARETNMQRTRNFVQSGSRTEPLREDIRALTQGESELAFMMDQEVRGPILAAGRMALTNPFEAGLRIATWIYDRTSRPGIANPQVQEAMARRLFTTATREGAQELRDALLALRSDNRTPQQLRDWMTRVLAANSATGEEDRPDQPAAEGGSLTDAYREARQSGGDDPAAAEGEEAAVDQSASPIVIEENGRFYVIPSAINGQQLTPENARNRWFAGVNPALRGPLESREQAEFYARAQTGN
jgi:hypothetical protein